MYSTKIRYSNIVHLLVTPPTRSPAQGMKKRELTVHEYWISWMSYLKKLVLKKILLHGHLHVLDQSRSQEYDDASEYPCQCKQVYNRYSSIGIVLNNLVSEWHLVAHARDRRRSRWVYPTLVVIATALFFSWATDKIWCIHVVEQSHLQARDQLRSWVSSVPSFGDV